MPNHGHIPVLPQQTLEMLAPKPGQTVLDGTLGRGGHAELIIPMLSPGGRYIGLDLDPTNANYARQRLQPIAEQAGVSLIVRHASFQDARAVLDDLGIAGVDGILADLGFASTQMDDPQRGLAFSEEGPLDMRLNPDQTLTAADLVNDLPERELANIIFQLGEDRLSRRIARKIVEVRGESPIQTTSELAQIVKQAYGYHAAQSRMHPATRTFMALRIAVNGELEALDRLLASLEHLLLPAGRAVLISFHSLEDRRVKQSFAEYERRDLAKRLTRKPITPKPDEVATNPRSRSAKLRAMAWQGA